MHLRRRRQVTTAGLAVCAVALAACSSSSSSSSSSSGAAAAHPRRSSSASLSGTLNGSGSTFQTRLPGGGHRGLQVGPARHDGQLRRRRLGQGPHGPGLGGRPTSGVRTPRRSRPPRWRTSKGKTVLYFPVFLGPITISYNLSGVSNLKLDATVIAEIFGGKITTWNNPAITALNPGVSLPSTPITIAVRSDSSGTTQNFSLFLVEAAGSAWTLGSSSTIKWPVHRPRRQRQRRAWRRSSSPPPGPSGTWTTPTPRPPG